MSDNSTINEVIVVEGKCDTQRLREVYGPTLKTIETKGAAIDEEIIERIKEVQAKYGVIVLTDPDYPGKRIRQIIKDHVPDAKHAHLPQSQTISKKKGQSLGIEHAKPQDIKTAIQRVLDQKNQPSPNKKVKKTSMSTLMRLGLASHPQAQSRRDKVCRHFNLGHLNAKQLQKELYRYQISVDEVTKVLEEGE